MKDMPTVLPPGLAIACLLPREDVRDAFVSLNHASLAEMPKGAVVGTSSLRRRAQLLNRRPDLKVVEFRGNVQTRLRLACAGLRRLGQADLIRAAISPDAMLPAVAQGAIGIEARADDDATLALLAPIHDGPTATRLAAERAFLAALDGSCQTPIGGLAEIEGEMLRLRGEIIRPDGSECLTTERRGPLSDAAAMGTDAAGELRARAGPGFFET
jgi:hydroxymethylbilane synthase